MENKSIAIIGKGSSILRCKREIIEGYDDVAICGRPIFEGYEHLIGERADYDFCNCGDPRIYSEELIKKLGIKKVFNTGGQSLKKDLKICPNNVEYESNTREKLLPFFKDKYDLDPSTGLMAIETILRMKKYNKIGLFGFDMMEKGEKVYYFPKEKVQKSLQQYFNNKTYSNDGQMMIVSGHNPEKSYKYVKNVVKNNPDITFEIISNRKFI